MTVEQVFEISIGLDNCGGVLSISVRGVEGQLLVLTP